MKKQNKLRRGGETDEIVRDLKRKMIRHSMMQALAILMLAAVAIGIYCRSVMLGKVYDEMSAALIASYIRGDMTDYRISIGGNSNRVNPDVPVCIVRYDADTGTTEVLSKNAYVETHILDEAVKTAAGSLNGEGIIKELNLIYHLHESTHRNVTHIAFADYSYISHFLSSIYRDEVIIVATILAALYFVSLSTARSAVKPIVDMWEKQEQFIMDASHELKTPLTVIIANNEIMKNHAQASVQDQMKWIKSTEEEAKNMSLLIEDLMMLMRGKSIPESVKTELNLSKIVQQICLHFDAVAFEKNVLLDLDVQNGITVTGSEKWIKQLVNILMDNAIKYEPEGGGVRASLVGSGEKAVLTVTNKRSRIAEEDIPKLFDRFYRSDKARSEGGFGLGLSIAKNAAEAHGGTIRAESGNPEGCSFIVTLNRTNWY